MVFSSAIFLFSFLPVLLGLYFIPVLQEVQAGLQPLSQMLKLISRLME